MPANPISPPLSTEERAALRHLNSQGVPLKGARNNDAPVDEGTEANHEVMSREKVMSLVNDLLTKINLKIDQEERDYLLKLLTGLPDADEDPLACVATYRKNIQQRIEHDSVMNLLTTNTAEMINRLLAVALDLYADPAQRPWCDIEVFSREKKRLNAIPSTNRSDAERDYLRFLDKTENSGLMRRCCAVPKPVSLMNLVRSFPNFSSPLHYLAEQAAFSTVRRRTDFRFSPILLTGPAGIGKTFFATTLAQTLGVTTHVVGMASQSCGFALSGMDRGWSAARPGLVFNAIQNGETLSPIIVLDEIDKANQDARSDPLGPLYSLLEPRTSGNFRDEYAGFPIDASQVFWLATANNCHSIPEPLLSRFKVFEIEPPTLDQISSIAGNIYSEITENVIGAPQYLPATWQKKLGGHSVREIRMAIQEAIGKAALRAILSGDTAISITDDDLHLAPEEQQRMGFC